MISIIIPLYNGENFITKCLQSIIQQTFSDFQIIIINDGSTDNSLETVENFLKHNLKEKQYKVISQENRGQGAARNTGITYSEGEFITFIDQDDYIEIDYLEKFIKIIEQQEIEENIDIVISGYKRTNTFGKVKQTVSLKNCEWSKYVNITPWGKLYRTKFIKENDIQFLPVVLGEDVYFSAQAYFNTVKIIVSNQCGYHWVDNKKSLSNTLYKKNSEVDIFPLFNSLISLEETYGWKRDKYYEYFIFKTAVWFILYTASNDTINNHMMLCNKIYAWMENNFPDYLSNPYIGLFKLKGEKFYLRFIVWIYKWLIYSKTDKLFISFLSKRD